MRLAVALGDGPRIVEALADADLGRCGIQQIGDFLIAAIENGATGVRPIATRCAQVLRERLWEGDEELADQLDATIDPPENPSTLIDLRIGPDEVSELLESGDGVGGWVDLETGVTWQEDMFEFVDEDARPDFDNEPDRWLTVPSFGGRSAYRDMKDFISGVADPHLADRLAIAIEGSGAFGRFRRVLRRAPDAEDDWYEFANERRNGRARAWLIRAGYQPRARNYRPPAS